MSEELKPGTELSHYRIIAKIGEGGMGEVYRAEDTKLDRQVALKVLPAAAADDNERVRRFVQEAKAASALNHPNILTVFEIGSVDSVRYIATEFVDGETLRERLSGEPMTLGAALDIFAQAAAALNAAHEAGIVHRDIKPENIMVRGDGLVKVLDFGLAKLTERAPTTASSEDATRALVNTRPGMVMGTVSYMSPEQARGKDTDARTDVWSLGIVMFEILTRRCPFEGDGPMDIVSSILKDPTPSLRLAEPDLPRQLERIIDKTLRKDRDQRYQHIKDLHIDLDDLREELKFEEKQGKTVEMTRPTAAAKTIEASSAPATRNTSTIIFRERRFTLFHVLAIAAFGAAVIGGVWWLRSRVAGTPPIELRTTEIASWTSAPGELFSNASFSPDGKLIAFSSTRSGSKNIWVTQTTSSEPIQVTNDSSSNKDPIWSPRGDEIAFSSQKGNSGDGRGTLTGVWRVSALGGTPRSVGAVADGSFELRRWTASGKIYYQSQGDLYEIDIASGDTKRTTTFDRSTGKIIWADIADDEKTIAYVRQQNDVWQLFVSDVADKSPSKIVEGTGELGGMVWTPEKDRFEYSSMTDGVFQVYKADGRAAPVRVTFGENDSIVVDSSLDGRSMIVSSAKEESSLWRVNAADGQESPVSRSLRSELWPVASPDGERVAFQSAKNLSRGSNLFEGSIMVKSMKSRDDQATPLSESGFLPAWSPQGTLVAFIKKNVETFELNVANPNGGGVRRLTQGGIPAIGYSVSPYNHIQTAIFSWSPDGTQVAYVAEREGASNIWTVAAADGTEARVTDFRGGLNVNCPLWSADGKRIAFSYQAKPDQPGGATRRGLRIVDLTENKVIDIFETDKNFRLIGWTPDENGLIIAESEKQSGLPPETILHRVTTPGGALTPIARINRAYFYNISLSADRRFIAFAAREQDMDDIWVLSSAGGEPRRLTRNNDSGVNFSRLTWLRDGSSILFGKQTRFSLLSIVTEPV